MDAGESQRIFIRAADAYTSMFPERFTTALLAFASKVPLVILSNSP
jgi:hypothetical protein